MALDLGNGWKCTDPPPTPAQYVGSDGTAPVHSSFSWQPFTTYTYAETWTFPNGSQQDPNITGQRDSLVTAALDAVESATGSDGVVADVIDVSPGDKTWRIIAGKDKTERFFVLGFAIDIYGTAFACVVRGRNGVTPGTGQVTGAQWLAAFQSMRDSAQSIMFKIETGLSYGP